MYNPEDLFKDKLKRFHHLRTIRDRLWSKDGKSRVSVMVGAGFSLNAEKLEESFESMSTWPVLHGELLKYFHETDVVGYKDTLELGQLFADEFGRANLDELLKESIPDQNYNPGKLHKELLKMPWADVYTTNYDTLLERTLPYIIEREYQVIYNVSDIPSSVAPRIVKLHGSFPSNRPFIFTKSDYDLYEEKSAAFVNMVQQSIMETTLVLIGFSGNDPNFEKWTKWVYQNLGEHMPKVYMLAYDELSNEHKLNERGITLINFKGVYEEDDGNTYERMFNDIFQFMSSKANEDHELNWPFKSFLKSSNNSDESLEFLRFNRSNYPGWIVLPEKIKRKNLTEVQFCIRDIQKLIGKEMDLAKRASLVSELIWLQDLFCIPIDITFHRIIKDIVEEYYSVSTETKKESVVYHLILRLIKEARLDFNERDSQKYFEMMENEILDDEIRNCLIYEKVLLSLFRFNFNEVEELLQKWKLANSDLVWKVKKAGILNQINDKDNAEVLLENSLNQVRKLISINRRDIGLLSLEGIVLASLVKTSEKHPYHSVRERLMFLEQRLCNPLMEMDLLHTRIKNYEKRSSYVFKKGFDPNRITNTQTFSSTIPIELIDAYTILNSSDQWGVSLINESKKDSVKTAIKNVEYLYPFYSWIKYVQFGDIKSIDDFFSREIVYKTDKASMSMYFNILMNGLETKTISTNFELLIEIVSRLYFALTEVEKKRVDIFAIELFVDKEFYYKYIYSTKKILLPLFNRILFDKNMEEQRTFIEKLLTLPIIGEPDNTLNNVKTDDHIFFEPIIHCQALNIYSFSNGGLKVDVEVKRRLLEVAKNETGNVMEAALMRLVMIFNSKSLDAEEERELKDTFLCLYIDIRDGKETLNILTSYLVSILGDDNTKLEYTNHIVQKDLPRSYSEGVIASGSALEMMLSNLSNMLPSSNVKNNEKVKYVNDETYRMWLTTFYKWWDNQERWLLQERNDRFLGGNNDLKLIVIFLKNNLLSSIPIKCVTSKDREVFRNLYMRLLENKPDMALLLVPVLLRIDAIEKDEMERVYEGMLCNNNEIAKASIAVITDFAILSKNGELEMGISSLKSLLLNLFLYRKEFTLVETISALMYITKEIPSFFEKEEYELILKSLRLLLSDMKNNLLTNNMEYEEFEVLSNATGLAGYMCKNGTFDSWEQINDWKEIAEKNRLPEVRKYAELFYKRN